MNEEIGMVKPTTGIYILTTPPPWEEFKGRNWGNDKRETGKGKKKGK